MERYADSVLHPGRISVVLAGDLGSGRLTDAADRTFGAWCPPGAKTDPAPIADPPRRVSTAHHCRVAGAQSHVGLAVRLPTAADPRWPAIVATVHHLAGAQLSVLDLLLRERRGYTFGVEARLQATPVGGFAVVSMRLAPSVAEAAAEEMVAAVDALRTSGVREPACARTVRSLRDAAPRQLQSSQAVAAAAAQCVARGRPIADLWRLYQGLADVTAHDMTTVLARHFAPGGRHTAIVGPSVVPGR